MAEAVIIDVRGLKCPLPVLKAERRMRAFAAGTRFVILATDPMAAIDMPHFCAENCHRLLASSSDGGTLTFEVVKA